MGFCCAEVNPEGPVHAYVAFATVEAVNRRSCPAQIGPSLPAVGAAGIAVTVAVVVAAAEAQPLTIACTV